MTVSLFIIWMWAVPAADVWRLDGEDFSEFLSGIETVSVRPDGATYLLDSDNWVYFIDAQGQEKARFAGKGQGPGELNRPKQIAYLPEDKVLVVLDARKSKIIIYTELGEFLKSMVVNSKVDQLIDLERFIFRKYHWTRDYQDGKFSGQAIYTGNADGSARRLFYQASVAEESPLHIIQTPQTEGVFGLPWDSRLHTLISPDRKTLVTCSTLDLKASFLNVETAHLQGVVEENFPNRPLLDDEIKNFRSMRLQGKTVDARQFDNPDQWPAIEPVFLDAKTRLWIVMSRKRDADDPKPRRYMVYDQAGKKHGEISLPAYEQPHFATDQFLWVTGSDPETDELYIAKRPYSLE